MPTIHGLQVHNDPLSNDSKDEGVFDGIQD